MQHYVETAIGLLAGKDTTLLQRRLLLLAPGQAASYGLQQLFFQRGDVSPAAPPAPAAASECCDTKWSVPGQAHKVRRGLQITALELAEWWFELGATEQLVAFMAKKLPCAPSNLPTLALRSLGKRPPSEPARPLSPCDRKPVAVGVTWPAVGAGRPS